VISEGWDDEWRGRLSHAEIEVFSVLDPGSPHGFSGASVPVH
jgi:hypothetical protein